MKFSIQLFTLLYNIKRKYILSLCTLQLNEYTKKVYRYVKIRSIRGKSSTFREIGRERERYWERQKDREREWERERENVVEITVFC